MKAYIVGNSLVSGDNEVFRLLPFLRKQFPHIPFKEADPNENFIPEEDSIIIDSVSGIQHVQRFDDIDDFVTTRSITPHDYDLGFHLQLLKKLHKLQNITIVGLPMSPSPKTRVELCDMVASLVQERKNKRKQ